MVGILKPDEVAKIQSRLQMIVLRWDYFKILAEEKVDSKIMPV